MDTKNKSLFDGKHRYVSKTALICSCSYKKRFVVTCLLFNSSSSLPVLPPPDDSSSSGAPSVASAAKGLC